MRLTGTITLSEQLTRQALPREEWARLGRLLRRFHREGVFHADLNANNILLDAKGGLFLIDFDRGRLRPPDPKWQQANLARLRRSLDKLQARAPQYYFSEADWQALIEAYGSDGPD